MSDLMLIRCGFVEVTNEKVCVPWMDGTAVHYSYKGTANFYIWKMKNFGVEKSWSQFLKISWDDNLQIYFGTSYTSLLPLCENGDTLILANPILRQLILYNWRTNKMERVITTKRKSWVFLNNYIESLVSTNGK